MQTELHGPYDPPDALVALDRVCAACGVRLGQLPVLPLRKPELHHRDGCPRTSWPWREAVLGSEGEPFPPAEWLDRGF